MRLALAALLVSATASAAPMTVVVLYFDNHTALREYDVLQKGMADMLITDLGASDQLRIVEREKLEALTAELKLQQTKLFDPATAQKLGKLAGAGFAITGAFTGFEPDVRIDVRLAEVGSGKVVVSAQVKGAKDRFFELEQELVAKFLGALAAKAPAPEGGKATLAHVLGYSQGLDTADKGEVKAASAQLAGVVRDAPDFQLAKTRYAALLKRLREAGQQREAALTGDEAALVAGLDAEIAKNAGAVLKGSDAQERHFCTRALRTAYLWWKLDRAASGPHGPSKTKVLSAAAAKPLLMAIWENERALEAEYQKNSKSVDAGSCAFALSKGSDHARARALQIPFDDEDQVFHPAVRVPELIARSNGDRILPTLFAIEPALTKQAHALLDAATALQAQPKNHAPGRGLDAAALGLARARVQVFLAERNVEGAVSALQTWLERFPKASEYKIVETTVEDLLGVGSQTEEDSAAAKACSATQPQLRRLLTRRFDAGGTKAVGGLLGTTGAACRAAAHAVAAWLAAGRGECGAAKKYAEQAGGQPGLDVVCP